MKPSELAFGDRLTYEREAPGEVPNVVFVFEGAEDGVDVYVNGIQLQQYSHELADRVAEAMDDSGLWAVV